MSQPDTPAGFTYVRPSSTNISYTGMWLPAARSLNAYIVAWNDGKFYVRGPGVKVVRDADWACPTLPPRPEWLGPFDTLQEACNTLTLIIS